jgi:hypothetical protein
MEAQKTPNNPVIHNKNNNARVIKIPDFKKYLRTMETKMHGAGTHKKLKQTS